MLKRDLVDRIAERHGLKKLKAKAIVDDVFDVVTEGMAEEGQVQISGFGVFEKVSRPSRKTRNPHTGEQIDVKPGYRPRFRVSSNLKKAMMETLGEDEEQASSR